MHSEHVDLPTGARVFVATKGSGDELVLFLHAVGGDHTSWYHQMEALADRYTVASYDFRGHSRSAAADEISIATFARDTIALIEHLGFRRAHLVGLSMGGVVALEVFNRRSDAVQSLALANSWAYHAEGDARIAFMTEQLGRMTLPESSRMLIPALLAPGTAKDVIDRAIEVESRKDPQVFLASWTSMFQADYRRMLEHIDVPLLLIGGTLDQVTPADPLSTTIHAAVPLSQLVIIEGAGHFSKLDHPVEFNAAMRAHLLRARAHDSQRMTIDPQRTVTVEASTTAHALMALLARR